MPEENHYRSDGNSRVAFLPWYCPASWRKKRFNYHVGRDYYVSIIYEIPDASDFDKGNADTLILYVHP